MAFYLPPLNNDIDYYPEDYNFQDEPITLHTTEQRYLKITDFNIKKAEFISTPGPPGPEGPMGPRGWTGDKGDKGNTGKSSSSHFGAIIGALGLVGTVINGVGGITLAIQGATLQAQVIALQIQIGALSAANGATNANNITTTTSLGLIRSQLGSLMNYVRSFAPPIPPANRLFAVMNQFANSFSNGNNYSMLNELASYAESEGSSVSSSVSLLDDVEGFGTI